MDPNSNNRSNFRKTYPITRFPRKEITIGSAIYNANQFTLHRDHFIVSSEIGAISYGLYEEYTATFNKEESKTISFLISFPVAPIVVLEQISGDVTINPYVVSVSTTTLVIGVSAPFVGIIKYRAVYNNSYPVYVRNYPTDPATIFYVSAGSTVVSGLTTVTASFSPLPTPPSYGFFTPYDSNGNRGADVFVSTGSFDASSCVVELSAPLSNKLNFIEFQ
jgi:hypothetical protein